MNLLFTGQLNQNYALNMPIFDGVALVTGAGSGKKLMALYEQLLD
jgi:hypothetical protein